VVGLRRRTRGGATSDRTGIGSDLVSWQAVAQVMKMVDAAKGSNAQLESQGGALCRARPSYAARSAGWVILDR
jgi:hypothetical protein